MPLCAALDGGRGGRHCGAVGGLPVFLPLTGRHLQRYSRIEVAAYLDELAQGQLTPVWQSLDATNPVDQLARTFL
ncbi:MAG: hypothetical protein R3C62_06965 [Chloroflexota bacterium]